MQPLFPEAQNSNDDDDNDDSGGGGGGGGGGDIGMMKGEFYCTQRCRRCGANEEFEEKEEEVYSEDLQRFC